MKSPVIAFFLSFFSGLGHLYIGRYVRAFFYLGGSIGIGIVSLFAATVLNGDEDAIILGAIALFFLWGINMLDMILTISNKSNGVFEPKPEYQNINGQMVLVNPHIQIDPLEQAQREEKTKIMFMSIIPGASHLYMGYTKRGISIMLSVLALVIIPFVVESIFYRSSVWMLILFVPILAIYSIFDARYILKSKQIDIIIEDNSIVDSFINRMLNEHKSNWALLFSLIPGLGHLVLGYSKQGFQLLLTMVGTLVLINDFNMYFLRYFTLLIWAYSFFDTLYKLRTQPAKQQTDDSLLDAFSSYKKWIGLGLIILGVYYGGDIFATRFLDNINIEWYKIYMSNKHLIVSAIATFVIIFVGIKFMTSSISEKVKKKESRK